MSIAILIRGLDLFRISISSGRSRRAAPAHDRNCFINMLCPGIPAVRVSYTAAIAFLVIALLTVIVTWAIRRMGRQKTNRSIHRRKETSSSSAISPAASLVVIFVFPIYWLLAISFKTPGESSLFTGVVSESIQFKIMRCVQGCDAQNRRQQSRACFGINLLRHDLRHHRRLLTGAIQDRMAKTSQCGSSRNV